MTFILKYTRAYTHSRHRRGLDSQANRKKIFNAILNSPENLTGHNKNEIDYCNQRTLQNRIRCFMGMAKKFVTFDFDEKTHIKNSDRHVTRKKSYETSKNS